MMDRVTLVAVTVAVGLLLSLVLPAFGNPLAILALAAAALALTFVKDRRAAIGLAVAGSITLVVIGLVLAQPSYIQGG